MLKNYFKIALRNLRRHKVYTFINIFGLAVGMATCLLILLYVQDEHAYDRFHEKADRIYRVVGSTGGDGQPTNANGAFPVGPALVRDYPEVRTAVRFREMGQGEKRAIARGSRRFYEEGFYFADSTVFEVFTFPFLQGSPETALHGPHRVVITERAAKKYFPDEDPLGKTLSIDAYNDGRFIDYEVTGVVRDIPSYSHLKFDFLASWSSQTDTDQGWWLEMVYTYILLAPGASAERLEADLPAFVERHAGPDHWLQFGLQPLTEIRLHSNLRAELEPNGDIAYVYLFSAIALFVLLIACINFMNLTTARSATRAREVGVRKVIGAHRRQLIRQFLAEAVLLSAAAVLLALLLIELLLPVFNTISGKAMTLRSMDHLPLIGGLAGLTLLTGLLAGSYPAFFLSSFRPVEILKGKGSPGGSASRFLRQGLVTAQFAISIGLMACTGVVYHQMDFIRSKNLGFAKDQILILPLNEEVRAHYEALRSAFLQHPGVAHTTLTEQVPARAGNGASYRIEGVEEPDGFTRLFVDPYFSETYGIEIAAGRDFSEPFSTEAGVAFMVNEAFVRAAGWTSPEDAVGKQIRMQHAGVDWDGHIVGVTRDFNLFSLRQPVYPVVMSVMPMERLNFISARISAEQVHRTLAQLEAAWKRFVPSYPFDYYFLDEDFDRLHLADRRLGQVFTYFALLALLVACLGLFGLAAFTAEQRTKEIGIRKVLGASVPSIVALLSKEFTRLVLVAFLIAGPPAYLAMAHWLADFAYRIDLGAGIFLLSGGLALLVACLTVSYQSLRAALADPVKALRYE